MKTQKFFVTGTVVLSLLFITLLLAGCPDPGSSGGEPDLTGSVSISGTIKIGDTITANTESLEGTGTISYQWQKGSSANGEFANIANATAASYTVNETDVSVGGYVRVSVTRHGYKGSKESNALVINAAEAPTPVITAVTVTPDTASVAKGGTASFTAEVTGTYDGGALTADQQQVTWAVLSTNGSTITQEGVLTVHASETAGATIMVTATSTVDISKKGTATVTITDPPPALAGTAVIPAFIKVGVAVTATTSGFNAPALTYRWQTSATATGTYAAATGAGANTATYTPAAADEGKFLRVRITASGTTGEVTSNAVQVRDADAQQPVVTAVTVSPPTVTVAKGSTQQFTAGVAGTYQPGGAPLSDEDKAVTWLLIGGNAAGTSLDENGLLTVAEGETSLSLTVKATSVIDATKSGTAEVGVPSSATYTVNTPSLDGGSINVTGGSNHNGGTIVHLTIHPEVGYILTGFTLMDANVGGNPVAHNIEGFDVTFTMPAHNVWARATFVDRSTIMYAVNLPATVAHGTIIASPEEAAEGTTVTLTATPDMGARLVELTVKDAANDVILSVTGGDVHTFTMPASDVTVSVEFEEMAPNSIGVYFTGFGDEHINLEESGSTALSKALGNTLTVEVIGDYEYYQWYLDGSMWTEGSGDDYARYEVHSYLDLGLHTLTVIVYKNAGWPYSKEVTFKVVY